MWCPQLLMIGAARRAIGSILSIRIIDIISESGPPLLNRIVLMRCCLPQR